MSLSFLEWSCTHELVNRIFLEHCAVCSITSTTCLTQCFNSLEWSWWHLFLLLHLRNAIDFLISRLRERKLRVCGAQVEWTLQKGGGGFEIAIKIIAYHSLSPSFSPLKSIIFIWVSPFCHLNHVGGHPCKIDQSQLRLCTVVVTVHHRYQAVASRDKLTSVDDWGIGPHPFLNALPIVCWLLVVRAHLYTHTHTTRRPLATDHVIMISLPSKGHTLWLTCDGTSGQA